MRRKMWMGWVAGVSFLLAGSMPAFSAEKQLFCADWALYGKHTPYIVAREKGFFKDEGIDITIRRGYGSSDTTKRVGSKECPYGMAAMGPQVIGKNKGFKIKTVGILEHKFQEIIYYFTDSGINTPKDLEGKRLTPGSKASADYAMFPVFAAPNGIDTSKINWVFMAPGGEPGSLGAGKVDAVISYDTQKPRFLKVAKQAGKTLKWMLYADYGLDLYSAGVLTHTDNLKGSAAKTTRGMVKAIYRGVAYTLANPEESVKIFLKSFPEQSTKSVTDILNIWVEHLYDGLSEKQGLGHTDPKKMRTTIKVTLDAQKMPIKIKAEDLFTNEYVDALPKAIRFARPKKGTM